QPPDCPTWTKRLDKMPNGWGEVQFSATPPIVKQGERFVLEWKKGPSATYELEYYTPQTGLVQIPKPGEAPLAAEGQYPATGEAIALPPGKTPFTLNVTKTFNNVRYTAQLQVIVTVERSPPVISTFTAVRTGEGLELTWETDIDFAGRVEISVFPSDSL